MDSRIDPQLRGVARAFRLMQVLRRKSNLGSSQRIADWLLSRRRVRGASKRDVFLPRPDGSSLKVSIYSGQGATRPAPGVVWIHGGGYAAGVPEMEAPRLQTLVEQGAVVVTPHYRRSGEAAYPAAIDDCAAALLWLRDHAAELNVDDTQLIVGGGSAGGGLTAALSVRMRDTRQVAIAFQMPLYPMIADQPPTENAATNTIPPWNAATNEAAWRLYLGALYGTDQIPADAAPARASTFAGLPPTFTYVSDIETFHDETLQYVAALEEAGVPVRWRVFPGAIHGFDGLAPRSQVARDANAYFLTEFQHHRATYFAAQPTNRAEPPHHKAPEA